jgi:hypothetical protein
MTLEEAVEKASNPIVIRNEEDYENLKKLGFDLDPSEKSSDFPCFNANLKTVESTETGLEISTLGHLSREARPSALSLRKLESPDQTVIWRPLDDGTGEFRVSVFVTMLHLTKDEYLCCLLDERPYILFGNLDGPIGEGEEALSYQEVRDALKERNEKWKIEIPLELRDLLGEKLKPKGTALESRATLPVILPHPTFIEARQFTGAISDGRDGRHWGEIPGAFALLHCPPKSQHQTRFEPNAMMLNWWGVSSAQPQALFDELARLDFDAVILFQVTLSAILHTEKARWSNVSLDSIIKLIGRDTDARRSSESREKWRRKVWRWLVLFDSMAVYGTRPGRWREPGTKGEKRAKMDTQALYSRDPLIRIVGTRDTEQGTFDGSAPPKEVSIVPGDWLMQFHGNRELLSEMGNVLQIAQISRGKPSGAWAACAGLMLNQLWREGATRATKGRNSRGKDTKTEVLKFRPFTRRELLAETVRSDYDVHAILNDPKNRRERVETYWKEATKELKKRGVIGYYAELKGRAGDNWREEWLDQPLDIRPVGETLENALTIHDTAAKLKQRSKPRATPKKTTESDGN